MMFEKWCEMKNNLYPGDEFLLNHSYHVTYQTLEEYVKSENFGKKKDTKLHLGLLPNPYIGDIKNSKIFILSLNPGLNPADYVQERTKEFQERYWNNICQNGENKFPFIYLDPFICSHPGYSYWNKKFKDFLKEIQKSKQCLWIEAQQHLSKHISTLELIPYHSQSFYLPEKKIMQNLQSLKDIKQYVHDEIVPKAINNEAIIIATRQIMRWNLPENENIIQFGEKTQARRFYIGKEFKYFNKILNLII